MCVVVCVRVCVRVYPCVCVWSPTSWTQLDGFHGNIPVRLVSPQLCRCVIQRLHAHMHKSTSWVTLSKLAATLVVDHQSNRWLWGIGTFLFIWPTSNIRQKLFQKGKAFLNLAASGDEKHSQGIVNPYQHFRECALQDELRISFNYSILWEEIKRKWTEIPRMFLPNFHEMIFLLQTLC